MQRPDAAPPETRGAVMLLRVAWPAFLAACALEFAVFAVVDPHDLQGDGMAGWSRQAVYGGAFFIFWGACAASSALTAWLGRSGRDVL